MEQSIEWARDVVGLARDPKAKSDGGLIFLRETTSTRSSRVVRLSLDSASVRQQTTYEGLEAHHRNRLQRSSLVVQTYTTMAAVIDAGERISSVHIDGLVGSSCASYGILVCVLSLFDTDCLTHSRHSLSVSIPLFLPYQHRPCSRSSSTVMNHSLKW